MDKITLIKEAIAKAEKRESKLVPENYEVPGFVSLFGRHLYNNLGSLAINILEIGSHLGCSLTSAISFNNIKSATAVDSFASDETEERKCKPLFLDNMNKWLPTSGAEFNLIHEDSFSFDLSKIKNKIDLYIYDGDHGEEAQRLAFTHFKDVFANEFIAVIDDFDWPDVSKGTYNGIKECGFTVLFEQVFTGNDHDNEHYWNGYAVFLLKKN